MRKQTRICLKFFPLMCIECLMHWNELKIFLFFSDGNSHALKYISLVTLTVQNALLGLSMRYARTREGDMFLSSTGNFFIGFHDKIKYR